MRFGACYCLYDDHEYLEVSLASLKNQLDKVLFLISDIPWNGAIKNNSKTIEFVKKLCSKNKNFELIQGHWTNEIDQRNFGLKLFYDQGIDYYFVIDNDEVYHDFHFNNIKEFIKNNPQIAAFHIEWNTYWSKKYYVIQPREYYQPVIAVKVSSFSFTKIRHGVTSITRSGGYVFQTKEDKYNGALIPPNVAICFHLSYARDNEFMKRKLETNSHAPEFIRNWYENVWLKWQPTMKNIHPVTPQQYNQAIRENFLVFPPALKTFIKKERFETQPCSIIILNWNSLELLKRCLDLVSKNTGGKKFEVIIVDNGSIKDESVDYLKNKMPTYDFPVKIVYNKTNLGFPGGVNAGILVADPMNDIVLLNVDAEVQPRWLREMYGTMINHPNCGLVGSLGNNVQSGWQREGLIEEDAIVPNIHFYCVLISRDLIDKIGVLDVRYNLGGYDDDDFGTRAKLAGYECWLSAKALVKHEPHQVFKLNDLDYYKIDPINREQFFQKFYTVLFHYAQVYDLYGKEDMAIKLGLKIENRKE